MKVSFLLVVSFCIIHVSLSAQQLRSVDNQAFNYGEKLKFNVSYGWVDAGEIVLEVKPEGAKIINRPCYQVVGTGRTVGTFDFFFKIRDHFESCIDKQAMVPWYFIKVVNEGSFASKEAINFNPFNNTTVKDKATYAVTENIQDILSSFYYARCLDYTNAKPGAVFPMEAFVDNKVTPMNYKFLGREIVTTKFGKISCLKFGPKLVKGRIFKKEEDMVMWVTDDKNHIPIRVEAKILVGRLKLDMAEYTGVMHPMAFQK